ncbi:MAG: SDR family NAD(P)-dependent oxidoreductase, partial [Edwardsiella sp. (in: enterobacteria)]
HIINIGSIAGTYAYPGSNVYGATKGFVLQFSRALRCDVHGTGVRVTDVEPGLLETEFSSVRFKGDEQRVTRTYQDAHALTADDIAEAVFWVATLPPHVNINTMEMMPVSQSFSPLAVYRGE